MTTITALPTPPTRADPTNFADRADAMMLAMPGFVTETNMVAGEVNAAAAAAAASAATAVNAPGTSGTSTSSLAIGTGAKAFNNQAGKAWAIGMFVVAARTSAPSNYMYGQVTGFAGGTLTINCTIASGAGTFTDWTISLTSPDLPTLIGKTIDYANNTMPGVASQAFAIAAAAAL